MHHHILTPPVAPARVPMVLDTDTANEIDDQFAVVHALLSQDRLALEAIYATLFTRQGMDPAVGVRQSEEEIHRLLDRLHVDSAGRVLRGADRFLTDDQPTVANAASDDLIRRAREPRNGRLWIAAIGALTNVASALVDAPEIAERICIVWLGGQAQHAVDAREFNLYQDPIAARIVFDSGAPLVHIPCYGAASHLLTTTAELYAYVRPQGEIGAYLSDIFRDHDPQFPGRSKGDLGPRRDGLSDRRRLGPPQEPGPSNPLGGYALDPPARRRGPRPLHGSPLCQARRHLRRPLPQTRPVSRERAPGGLRRLAPTAAPSPDASCRRMSASSTSACPARPRR